MSDLPPLPEPVLGRYRHYKGGEYEVIGVARHSETLEPLVLYRPLYNQTGLWVRPYAMFFEEIEHEGRKQSRFAPMDSDSTARPGEEALEVVESWAGSFPSADVDAIAGLFSDDAIFLGTTSPGLVKTTAGIRSYFESALLQNRPRSAQLKEHSVVPLSDTVVLVTGLDEVTGVKDGKSCRSPGRVTFVLALREGRWRIVHLHRSAVPG